MKKLIILILSFIFSLSLFSQEISTTNHSAMFYIVDNSVKNKSKAEIATCTDTTMKNLEGIEFVRILSNGDVLDKDKGVIGKVTEKYIRDINGNVMGSIHGEYGYAENTNKKIIAYFEVPIKWKVAALLIYFYPNLK